MANAEGIVLPAIVQGELYYGARNSTKVIENILKIHTLVADCTVAPIDQNTAEIYGELRKLLRSRGTPIPENDLWIAAQCQQHGLTLMTRDAHFANLPDLPCEAW